jgi:hypothetical protein
MRSLIRELHKVRESLNGRCVPNPNIWIVLGYIDPKGEEVVICPTPQNLSCFKKVESAVHRCKSVASWVIPLVAATLCACHISTSAGPSVEIGSAGGRIEAPGVVLEIPPGALASPVTISVYAAQPGERSDTAGFQPLSDVFVFEPSGLEFKSPAVLRIRTASSLSPSATLFWLAANHQDGFEPMGGTQFEAGAITAHATHWPAVDPQDGFENVMLADNTELEAGVITARVTHLSKGFIGTLLDGKGLPDAIAAWCIKREKGIAVPGPCCLGACRSDLRCVSGTCQWRCGGMDEMCCPATMMDERFDGCAEGLECSGGATRSGTCRRPAHLTNGVCEPNLGENCTTAPGDCGACCSTGQQRCSGPVGSRCVDTNTDHFNCGECGKACDTGQVCRTGACVADTTGCPAGSRHCVVGDACVDILSDRLNCGACGKACADSEVCSWAACVPKPTECATGTRRCQWEGACIDLQSDASHCGVCGNACGSGETCKAGACVPDSIGCASGTQRCVVGGTCIDLLNESSNCGACGLACHAQEACRAGRCVDAITGNYIGTFSGDIVSSCGNGSYPITFSISVDQRNRVTLFWEGNGSCPTYSTYYTGTRTGNSIRVSCDTGILGNACYTTSAVIEGTVTDGHFAGTATFVYFQTTTMTFGYEGTLQR